MKAGNQSLQSRILQGGGSPGLAHLSSMPLHATAQVPLQFTGVGVERESL